MSDFFPATNYPGIFASHEWVDAWQDAWSDCVDIIALQRHADPENCRDGFYTYQLKKLACIKLITLFSAGISTPASPSLRSEYFNQDKKHVGALIRSALRFDWDQFYIPDVILGSDEYHEFCKIAHEENVKLIIRDQSISYAVQLKHNTFVDYLKGLGSNTRLKLFNKRKKLFLLGDIRIENLWPNVDAFIDVLNQFHLQRWGRPCYSGRNRVQITRFLNQIALAGGRPDLSIIYCNDDAISAVLDLSYLGRIYNIQSGYREKFQDGISLGTLHFGFQLEKAFSSGADYYDFMAGNGKNSDYKKSLATHSTTLVSLMLVRSRWLQVLYLANNLLNRIKSLQKP
ncbi:GNAT family N-acetyltransferase [Cellvibrio sp. pealriver]|uniref:GNAT family N-acetyltransferase n=1 Tax=Cellvibrio sp. pealriver TaxID=1622269 RepID=UPI00066FD032|nr:GNAT family N-acetyltransferase [Cellvibrio sp. pealriver]